MGLLDIALIVVVIFLEILIVRLVDSVWPSKAGQLVIIIGAIVLDIVLIIFLSSVGQKPVAHIRSHLEGGEIPRQITLIGDYDNLDDDADLWVYVYSPVTGTYDFSEATLYYNVQTWDVRGLLVGSADESDAGKSFVFGVLVADGQASQQMRQGIDEIPDGASLVSEKITLRRIGEIALATPQPTADVTKTPISTPESTLTTVSAFPVHTPTEIPTIVSTNTVAPTPTHTATPPPTATPTPALAIGSTRVRPADGAVILYVPAGEFAMGSDDGGSNEQPIHTVTIDDFWIDQTEVTNAQYERCVVDGQCEESYYVDDNEFNGAQQPVVGVSWNDADTYCRWANGRLPTEAEWEYAARGPDGNIYPWGNESPTIDLLNYNGNVGKTTVVSSYSLNGDSWVGASDMAGNVWEWTSSLYQPYPYDADDGRENMNSTNNRVLRGGAWSNFGFNVRAAVRNDSGPDNRNSNIGFRCAQE